MTTMLNLQLMLVASFTCLAELRHYVEIHNLKLFLYMPIYIEEAPFLSSQIASHLHSHYINLLTFVWLIVLFLSSFK